MMLGSAVAQPTNAAIPSPVSNLRQTAKCADFTRLDVRNLRIRTAQRTFVFHDGIGMNRDGPPEQDSERLQPDWKAEIEQQFILEPAPDVAVWLLLIHDSHITGSGWRYYATAFRCNGGKLEEVFHRDGLSLRLDYLTSVTIRVSLNTMPGESTRTYLSYTWDDHKSRYVLSSHALIRRAFLPSPQP